MATDSNDLRTDGLGWVPSRFSAVKIAVVYCLVGSAWIYFSGTIAAKAVPDTALLEQVERLKGWLFVGVTTLLLGIALDRYFARIRLAAMQLRESKQELERINRLYAALSALNKATVKVKTREDLFREVTRALVDLGKFDTAWVGWLNRATQAVEVVSRAGDAQGYLDQIKVYADERPEGQGPTGTAIRQGRPDFSQNLANDPRMKPWRELAPNTSWRSAAAFPIRIAGKVEGALAVYAVETEFFQAHEVELLEEAAADLSFALGHLESETALRESERRLRFALEGANEGIWEVHMPTGHFYLSPRGCQILGYKPEELDGSNRRWEDMVHPDDVPVALAAVQEHVKQQSPSFAFEQRLLTKSGEWKWLMCRGRAIELDAAGEPVRVTGTHADIGERKQMEDALQQLSMRLLQAQDEERRRIARELHDSTAQHLAALTLNMANLRRLVGAVSAQADSLCSDSMLLATQAADEVRTLSYLLHPPLLEATGLVGAVEDYAQGFFARTGIAVKVEAPPDFGRLPPETELALFRVVQESLANVLRHSGGTRATIRFTRDTQAVTLEVHDMGKGISTEKLSRIQAMKGGAGVGLAGMRERLRLVGGHFEIQSGPNGTLLRAAAPVEVPVVPVLDPAL